MTDADDPARHIERLRWQCRRGMLELDYILLDFLENRFGQLTAEDRRRFVRLLAENDQDLQQWLIAGFDPVDHELAKIVSRIRQ